jgi:transcriptional regulator with XRE-family HTH domain
MTPQGFREVRKALKMSQADLATALDMSKAAIELYERGTRRGSRAGEPAVIPKTVRLALAALVAGVADYHGVGHQERPAGD